MSHPFSFWKAAAGSGAETEFVTSFSGGSLLDVTNPHGFKFTVGASNITITEVGIYGNSSYHDSTKTVYVRASDGTDLGNASVTWGNSSQWYWAALSSPVILSAGTVYYLMTASLGYSFTNYNISLTTTSAATVNDAANGQPPGASGTGTGFSEAGINFKYHL
jgi:hypothetical protein